MNVLSTCMPEHRWFSREYILTPEESKYSRRKNDQVQSDEILDEIGQLFEGIKINKGK